MLDEALSARPPVDVSEMQLRNAMPDAVGDGVGVPVLEAPEDAAVGALDGTVPNVQRDSLPPEPQNSVLSPAQIDVQLP